MMNRFETYFDASALERILMLVIHIILPKQTNFKIIRAI